MKNNPFVRFWIQPRQHPFRAALLLFVFLWWYRAFGIETGLSASGHTLIQRAGIYAFVLFVAATLLRDSFAIEKVRYQFLLVYLVGLYFMFTGLNFFWLGGDWRWDSLASLALDFGLFWLIWIAIEFLLLRQQPKAEKHSTAIQFKDETGRNELRLEIKRLQYLKSEGNYLEVHYLHEGELQIKLLRLKLKTVLEQNSNVLVQIHRSYLVVLDHIEQVNWHSKSPSLLLEGGIQLKIGLAFQEHLKQRLSLSE